MKLQGMKQLERTTRIKVPVEVVYELFMDNRRLPEWAPAVDAVLADDGGDEFGAGCTRTCAVTMNGRSGTMVERCVDAVPNSQASFVVLDDSFGFNRMLRDYGFTVHFANSGEGEASVRIETFYTPAGAIAALVNRLIMRRKFRAVVDALLAGLRASAEQHHRQHPTVSPHLSGLKATGRPPAGPGSAAPPGRIATPACPSIPPPHAHQRLA